MKKVVLLYLGLIVYSIVHAQDASHTAFNDTRAIRIILQNTPNILSNDDACGRVSKIVLRYFQSDDGPLQYQLEHNFSPQIADIVKHYLAKIDTPAMAAYLSINLTRIKQANRPSADKFKSVQDALNKNINERKELVIKLQNLIGSKTLQNQEAKLAALTKHNEGVDSLTRIISADTLGKPDAKIRLISAKNGLNAKLKAIGFDSLKTFKATIATLTTYVESYKNLSNLQKLITDAESQIWMWFGSLDAPSQIAYYNPQSTGKPYTVNAPYIQSRINISPQIQLFSPSASASVSTSSNNIETKAIDALAILLIKQVKKDIILRFLQTLRLQVAKQPLILDMFPKTFALLNEYPIYQIPTFGPVWSHAIAEDLIAMPEDVADGNYLRSKPDIKTTPDYKLFKDIILIAKLVALRTTIPQMVNYFTNNKNLISTAYIQNAFLTMKMVDQECISVTNGKASWILADSLNDFSQDDLGLFLGLLANKYPEVFKTFIKPFSINNTDYFMDLRKYLTDILIVLDGVQEPVKDRSAKTNAWNDPDTARTFWKVQRQLFETVVSSNIVQTDKRFTHFVELTRNCLSIYDDIEQKNYSAMIHEALEVICAVIPEKSFYSSMLIKEWKLDNESYRNGYSKIAPQLSKIDVILSGDHSKQAYDLALLEKCADSIYLYQDTISVLLVYSDKRKFINELKHLYTTSTSQTITGSAKHNEFIFTLSRLGEFLTDIEKAKSNEALAGVIQTYAVQPNSYIIKRNTRASVSFNAYLGTYIGGEYAPTLKPVFGLSAPVGLSFNWGLHKSSTLITDATFIGRNGKEKMLSGYCFSINFSIIDIGAVASYRINNGTEGALPRNFNFGQVLSPGFSLSYGLKDIPLNLTVGTEFTPELRSISKSDQQQPTVRIYTGIFYDFPFKTFSKR